MKEKEDIYSDIKVAHHKVKLHHLSKKRLIMPVFVQIDLSNKCNLSCGFCFYKITLTDWNSYDEIPTNLVFKVMKELKEIGVKAIEWTGGGSISMHPRYKDIFKKAKRLGFEQALVTNGTLLDEEALQIIKNFEWVRFSIDVATKETYEEIKGVDFFDKAINNMKRLLEIRKKNCVVGFSFIVCPDNYKEILKATKMAKEIGCDNIRFSLAMTPSKEALFDDIWEDCLSELELSRNEQTDDFRVFEFSNRINELAKNILSDYCGYHHFVGVIAANGCVYPCCTLKLDRRFNFGDLRNHTFKEIWAGYRRTQFIKKIENGCPYACWMTKKNQIIEYLMKKNPKHINFI